MNSQFKLGIVTMALLATPISMAASVTLTAKDAGTASTSNFTYSYTCNNGVKGMLRVSAANDKAGQKLAEVQARNICEET